MLKLREFLKKIRKCKTTEEERSCVNQESAEIRNLNKTQAEENKMRSLIKCVFITLLGYHTEYIHMTCIELLASSKFQEKRMAYMALSVLMDENSELLLLTSHTIKKDLEHDNQFIIGASLGIIGSICTDDMCRDCATLVIKLLSSSNPYIKKKAALALTAIANRCPELIESIANNLDLIFEDKNHGVLLSGLSLVISIFKADSSYISKYTKHIKSMIKSLKVLSNTNYAQEYDVNGITDPFLQVKIIEVLRYLAREYKDEENELNNLLASLSTNTDSNKNTGNAILYELVKTIISIKGNSGLKSLASNILAKFLSSEDNNYKYIALSMLQEVAQTDIASVQKHKNVIFSILKNQDMLMKRRSLDLIYIIIDSSNLKQTIKECLNFLLVGEDEFKLELTTKITQSLKKYSKNYKWEIDMLIKMLCLAGNYMTERTTNSIINLIIKVSDLHKYSMFKLFIAMKSNLGQEGLLKVGLYCLGELFELVSGMSVKTEIETHSINEEELCFLIEELNQRKLNIDTKEIRLNTYFKLMQKNIGEKLMQVLIKQIENEAHSFNFELQERATQYLIFIRKAGEEIKNSVKKSIPPYIESDKDKQVNKEILVDDNDEEDPSFNFLIKANNNINSEINSL